MDTFPAFKDSLSSHPALLDFLSENPSRLGNAVQI